jgi:hypothetical protein
VDQIEKSCSFLNIFHSFPQKRSIIQTSPALSSLDIKTGFYFDTQHPRIVLSHMAMVMSSMALDPMPSPRNHERFENPVDRYDADDTYGRFRRGSLTAGSGRAWTEDEVRLISSATLCAFQLTIDF